ncbi:MAG: GtrA family protein [Methylovulum sp.]|nr:GtrA family protein [Methylovulum sp.]
MKTTAHAFLRYLFSGGVAYVVDVSLFAGLHLWLQLPIAIANVPARAAGAITAYGLNHIWTFRYSLARVKYSALRYLGLWLINTGLSTILLQLLNDYSATSFYTINLKAMIELLLVLSNFTVCKFWVFKKP